MRLIIHHIKELFGILDPEIRLLRGKEMGQVGSIKNAYLYVKDGLIAGFGQEGDSGYQLILQEETELKFV